MIIFKIIESSLDLLDNWLRQLLLFYFMNKIANLIIYYFYNNYICDILKFCEYLSKYVIKKYISNSNIDPPNKPDDIIIIHSYITIFKIK